MRRDVSLFFGKGAALLLVFLAAACMIFSIFYFFPRSILDNTLLAKTSPPELSSGWFTEVDGERVALAEASRPAADAVGKTLLLVRTLPEKGADSASLCFQTKNECVRVWVDGEPVYSYGETPQRVFGHGVGAVWNIAELPEDADGKELRVELRPIEGRTGLSPYSFVLGSRGDVLSHLLESKLSLIAVTALLALITVASVVIFIVWAARRDERAPAVFWFTLLVLLSTVWMASDSGLLQFLIPDKGVIYLLFGCSFYILISPFALFLAEMQPERAKMYRAFSVVASAYTLLRIVLFVTGVLNFEAALWLLHLLMGVIIVSTNVALWAPVFRTKSFERPELILAVSVFTLAEGASLISFYVGDKLDMLRNGYSSGFYLGFFLFAIITIAGVIKRERELRRQAFKADFLERRAYTDELTGLLNVKGFDDKCEELLRGADARGSFAVLDFDVNFFSQFNATNGLEKGDALLRRIAAELESSCAPDELTARQEADHFVCLLRGDSLEAIAERVRAADEAAKSRMTAHMLLLSYGLVEITDRSLPIPALRNQAAVAKRTVKGNFEKNLAVYDRSLHELQLRELTLLSGFARSLENREYVIFLQPKIHIESGRLVGAEALVRRIEPDGTILSAGPIIEALERKGFITTLDYYVLELLCRFQSRCIAEGCAPCPISSNFSRAHLYDPGFPAEVAAIVDKYALPHELVEIELTETVFLTGKDLLRSMVSRLREAGFPVAIDDFGSGYSSLNMLKDVEVDVIKLDREFMEGFSENLRSARVIEHTLRLAQDMGITVVAEGIETQEQLEFLRGAGCAIVQGYYYSRPLPEAEFVEKYLLDARR